MCLGSDEKTQSRSQDRDVDMEGKRAMLIMGFLVNLNFWVSSVLRLHFTRCVQEVLLDEDHGGVCQRAALSIAEPSHSNKMLCSASSSRS